jgi:ubiquinone/menaquinone biosynthesis C-methylase UbiE
MWSRGASSGLKPSPPTGWAFRGSALSAILIPLALLAGCKKPEAKDPFPLPDRPVAPIVSPRYSNEDERDRYKEAATVMRLGDVEPGMTVADIGAGEGYYTVRLAPLVGKKGRVLAEDIVPQTRDNLARRVQRENLENVAVKLGTPNDPRLPDNSFDRVFMIHMYHEIQRPSEVLWNLRGDLKPGGRIIVVDADRPTARHGTPPKLLVCEFGAIGYELTRFERLADTQSYFAQFEPRGPKPTPEQIKVCAA